MSSLQPRIMAAASITGAFGLCGAGAGFTAAGVGAGMAAPSGIDAARSATEVRQFAESRALWLCRQAKASGPSGTFLHRRRKSPRQVNLRAFSLAGSSAAAGAGAGGAATTTAAGAGLAAGFGAATLTFGGAGRGAAVGAGAAAAAGAGAGGAGAAAGGGAG